MVGIEEITGDTCINKIYAMRNRCVTEQEYKCRHCERIIPDCYKPAKKTSVPIRRVIYSNGSLA